MSFSFLFRTSRFLDGFLEIGRNITRSEDIVGSQKSLGTGGNKNNIDSAKPTIVRRARITENRSVEHFLFVRRNYSGV